MSAHSDTLNNLKNTFSKAYGPELERVATDRELVLNAIRSRHTPESKGWSDADIAIFLSECHDENGNLQPAESVVAPENPVFQYIQFSGRGKERYAVVFGDGTQSEQDRSTGDRDRFLLDAIHMDIVGRLQVDAGQSTETNPAGRGAIEALRKQIKSTLLAPEQQGTESVLAAQQVQTWSDAARNSYFQEVKPRTLCDRLADMIVQPIKEELLQVIEQAEWMDEDTLQSLIERTGELDARQQLHVMLQEINDVDIESLIERIEKLEEQSSSLPTMPKLS